MPGLWHAAEFYLIDKRRYNRQRDSLPGFIPHHLPLRILNPAFDGQAKKWSGPFKIFLFFLHYYNYGKLYLQIDGY